MQRRLIAPFRTLGVMSLPYWVAVLLSDHGKQVLPFIEGQIVVPFGVVLAVAFYVLRTRRPFAYGAIELVVAVVVMWFSGNSPADPLAKGLGILGGVYVFVRGLDNMSKRLPEAWKRPWGRFLGP